MKFKDGACYRRSIDESRTPSRGKPKRITFYSIDVGNWKAFISISRRGKLKSREKEVGKDIIREEATAPRGGEELSE